MEIKLQGLALANVSEGALEERFQELLGDLAEVHENALEYVGGASGARKSKITLEVEISYTPALAGNPASTLIVSGAELKRPKKMKSAQPAYARDGGIFVEEEAPEQLEGFGKTEGAGGTVTPFQTDGSKTANGE